MLIDNVVCFQREICRKTVQLLRNILTHLLELWSTSLSMTAIMTLVLGSYPTLVSLYYTKLHLVTYSIATIENLSV